MAIAQAIRFASRQMRKAPGFTLTAVLALALGIGATTAIFSLVEAVLLRPLPFRDADRLVIVGDHIGNSNSNSVTPREIHTYSSSTAAFSSMGGFIGVSYELSGGGSRSDGTEQINGQRMTAEVFPTLGAEPLLGRVFTRQEEDASQPLAVISYSLWLNRFHRDPQVVGKTIDLSRRTFTIIGVMPRSFEFPLQPGRLNHTQLWVPMSLTPQELSEANTGFFGFRLIARLKDGVSLAQAKQDTDRVSKQVMREYPANMKSIKIKGDATPLREYAVADVRPLLRMLFLAVFIVLLIACANVAGLLLVRAIRRRREYAVRLALGATSAAILRESLVEGLLLSFGGGLLGLGLAAVVIRTALHLLPNSMPLIDSVTLDVPVTAFAILLAVATGVLCSIAPAFAALRTNLIESLKEGMRTSTGGSSHSWLRSALVVAEVAVAMVLVTTSIAFVRSLQKMRAVDPGFRADHVVVGAYSLPLAQYATHDSAVRFNRDLLDRLSSQPGAVAAAVATSVPASGLGARSAYTIEGAPVDTWKLKFAQFTMIQGDYFQTMGIPLLAGRYITKQDTSSAPLSILVNQSMARDAWPGQNPIGKRMHVGNPQKGLPWATVVGVVADTKAGSRDQPSDEQWYLPVEQPAILFGEKDDGTLLNAFGAFITLRSMLPPEQAQQQMRAAVGQIDPLLALNQVQTMSDVISDTESPRTFNTGLISAFAAAALLLAITGIYAVIAFSVSLRTQEIAIRMALGARRSGIRRLVLTGGVKLALIGCAIGVVGSMAVSRLIKSLLFDVSPTDPLIYAGGAVVMIAMALLASALPATKAASTDPIKALRAV